jgi:tetratricopeptide (TPR) repeat protein/DNA-binding SARP family transcriptional activator
VAVLLDSLGRSRTGGFAMARSPCACRVRVRSGVTVFRLLGAVELELAGRLVELGPVKQRTVWAALLVDAGHLVTWSDLAERVWGEVPPAGPRRVLYTYGNRVRRVLDRANAAGEEPQARLVRRAGGYLLEIDPDRVDLHRFRRLVATAREPSCSDDDQADLLREALRLWRGTPLPDLPGEWAAGVRDTWQKQRIGAVVHWAEAELRLGRHEDVIGPVRTLLAEHPFAEPLAGVLIRALAAAGQDAEALDCFAVTRARLVDELGIEPGPGLRAVHEALRRGELTQRTHTAAPPASSVTVRPVPAQLPADVHAFTGRQAELSELDSLLAAANHTDDRALRAAGAAAPPSAALISAVSGTAGVGKTALAICWAHRVRDAFGDGQLYVNLRGYDPEQPVSAADALAGFLSALGVAGQDIPLDEGERAARYRTEISGRRMLVVLDNAGSVEQVRPLLPGTASCVVVVTSRDSLAGLVARHGARRLDLDLLPIADAVILLRRLIGERVVAEPDAAAVLAQQCGRLPLALRVAAELATARATVPLSELVGELADQQRRLDLLDAGGDPRAAVRAVFSWSYQHLPAEAGRVFRLLGLHPGPDLDPYAVAALAGHGLDRARRLLGQLTRAHLTQPTGPGRHGMHDLVRAYAARLAHAEDSEAYRQAALTGLFDYYLATAGAAMDTLYPAERHRRPHAAVSPAPAPPLTERAAARAWLDAERHTLTAVCAHTAAHGWPAHTTRLSATLFRYLDTGGYYPDALTVHSHALYAARHAGDQAGEAYALTYLGAVHFRMGRYESAADHNQRALALHRRTGDRAGEARTLNNLGTDYERLGRYGPAADHYQQALLLYRRIGDRAGEADALNNLGEVDRRLGRYGPALEHHRQALALYRELGDRVGEAHALTDLGDVGIQAGRYGAAADDYQESLTLFRELGHRVGEAYALSHLGDAHARLGRYGPAADYHGQALALSRETGDRYGEACALNGVGEAMHLTGRSAEALAQHGAALAVAVEIGERDEQARAHAGLGQNHHAAGDLTRAREHWQLALALYTDLSSPRAEDARAQLVALG